MRQTLLRIPLDADWWLGFGSLPGFGFGLVLLLWALFGGAWLYRNRQNLQLGNLLVPGMFWVLMAFVIVNVPHWVQRGPRAMIATQSAIIEQQVKNPQLVEHFIARGQAYEAVYEYGLAADDFRAAIELAPKQDTGYLPLAWLYATCPDAEFRDGKKSLSLAQTAFKNAHPKTANHWDTLAAAYAEAGDYPAAEKAGQNAAELAAISRDPLIRGRLPDIRDRLEEYRNQQPHLEPRFSQTFPQSLPIRGYGFLMFLGFIAGEF